MLAHWVWYSNSASENAASCEICSDSFCSRLNIPIAAKLYDCNGAFVSSRGHTLGEDVIQYLFELLFGRPNVARSSAQRNVHATLLTVEIETSAFKLFAVMLREECMHMSASDQYQFDYDTHHHISYVLILQVR